MQMVRRDFIEISKEFSAKHTVYVYDDLAKDHPYFTSAKDWVGGSRKLPVLLTFSTVFMMI